MPFLGIGSRGTVKRRPESGAFATLLGLTFVTKGRDSRRLSWRAVAVGDSCLFVVRDDRLQISFPLEDATQFDNNPALVCSNPDNLGELWENVHESDGECVAGDSFILASDALACWFLGRNSEGGKPWRTLLALDEPEWGDWVEEQRRAGLMRNDDTTLTIIRVA